MASNLPWGVFQINGKFRAYLQFSRGIDYLNISQGGSNPRFLYNIPDFIQINTLTGLAA
jgi:hypothetical protein